MEDDVGLPAPFADGKALGALETVANVARATQGRADRSPCPAAAPSRLDRRLAAAALRAGTRRPARDAGARVQILTVQRAYHNLNAAVEQYTAVVGEPPLALVSCLPLEVHGVAGGGLG
jgi:hypothetical protein